MLPVFSFVALYKQSVPFVWTVTSRRVDSRDERRAWRSSITNMRSRLKTNQTKNADIWRRCWQTAAWVHSPFGMFACSLLPGIITEGDSPLKAGATHSCGRGCFEVVLIRRQKNSCGDQDETPERHSGTARMHPGKLFFSSSFARLTCCFDVFRCHCVIWIKHRALQRERETIDMYETLMRCFCMLAHLWGCFLTCHVAWHVCDEAAPPEYVSRSHLKCALSALCRVCRSLSSGTTAG